MIFLDTSGIYALADRDDKNHEQALHILKLVRKKQEEILVHNYVIVESAALLQRRLGQDVALRFLKDTNYFTIVWVDSDLHDAAVDYLEQGGSGASLVDALSFLVMKKHQLQCFLGFDRHFNAAGFLLYG